MFSEILKIIPKLDSKDLANMERTLGIRFARVAKKFGGGIMSVLKGGGILGTATFFLDKILNPLKEVQESIDKTLKSGDDLKTYAKQFNTTAGNLARLQAFGKATGLDADSLRTILEKFQSSVAQSGAQSWASYFGKFFRRPQRHG
jgi:methyl-accepting chemotaxis protein